jgi:amidophosphoribosyltransferase
MKRNSLDVFELIYFARPESIIDGISVHECRKLMGHALGQHITRIMDATELMSIDTIIPVPESGNVSALALAHFLRIPLQLGFHKNSYCNRSFIMPDARSRLKTVVRKLSAVRSEFDGKNVLLVDDSIVRGNTSREVVRMARNAGARKIVFVSSSPAIKYEKWLTAELVLTTES